MVNLGNLFLMSTSSHVFTEIKMDDMRGNLNNRDDYIEGSYANEEPTIK